MTDSGVDWWSEVTGGGPSLIQGPQKPLPITGGAVVDRPEAAAGFWTNMRASLAPDDQDKIKRYSEALNVPVARFGVTDGNIGYIDENNKFVRVTPSVSGSTGVGDAFNRVGQYTASQIGPAAPQLAGGVVGSLMGPTPLSIPAAGAAAGATDIGRQMLDRLLAGESVTDLSFSNAGAHALGAGVGQSVAYGVSKLMNSNPLGVSGYDRAAASDPKRIAEAEALKKLAKDQYGIDLTPGEATGLRSVLQRERQLGRNPATADIMYDFANKRKETQIIPAIEGQLNKISTQPATVGTGMLREGAGATIEAAKKARSAAARPLYESVVRLENIIPEEKFAPVATDPFMKRQLQILRNNPLYAREFPQGAPDSSLPVVDALKKRLDSMIKEAAVKGNVNHVRLLSQRRDALVGIADDAFPDYPAAREAFAGMSPEVTRLTKGIVGRAAKETVDDAASRAAVIFGSRDPVQIATARSAFERAGQSAEWSAGLKAYLSHAFERAARVNAGGESGNVAGKFVASVFGDPTQRNSLKAAMGPQDYGAFENFMHVLTTAAKGLPEGSPTATDVLAQKALAESSMNIRKIFGMILSPFRIGDELVKSGERAAATSGAQRLAAAIVDPENVMLLRGLRSLNPRSEAARVLVSHIITRMGITASGVAEPRDFPPPALSGLPDSQP